MSPSQKSMHNCRQLEIMSGVVLLIGLQLARGISNNFLLLHQYCAKTLERGITKDLVRLGFIRRSQNWSSDQFLFQSVESNITLRRPNVLDVLLKKIWERLGDLRKVFNESSSIACETEETAQRKHGGPITHRSQDRNLTLLYILVFQNSPSHLASYVNHEPPS